MHKTTAQNVWIEIAYPAKSSRNLDSLSFSRANYTLQICHPFYMINKYHSTSLALVLYTTTTVIQYRPPHSKTSGIIAESAFRGCLPKPLLDLVMVSVHMEPHQYSPRWRDIISFSPTPFKQYICVIYCLSFMRKQTSLSPIHIPFFQKFNKQFKKQCAKEKLIFYRISCK